MSLVERGGGNTKIAILAGSVVKVLDTAYNLYDKINPKFLNHSTINSTINQTFIFT